jgi:hypothetical protein
MATAREVDPFLKADLPNCALKHHERSLPRRAPGFPPYDMGARPHMSYRLTQRRSVQLPRGYAPLHFWGNQRSGRRTAAQGACNRPTVKCPFIFAVTSGQEGEPPRKKRTTAPRLCAPSASTSGPTWGPRPTCHTTDASITGCGKIAPPLAPMPRVLGAITKD